MFRKRKLIKAVAIFFILQILFDVTYPTISYALTAGPTSPEATSFEPVDTTDMVNTMTGDFVYNIPLLEVPGPSGGFPIAMSYHAGILTQEESSWVGLGWTLNPGSINRHVNGFADDHKNVKQASRFYWEGTETYQVDIGINYGFGGFGYAQGVSIGYDTYQGFGVGNFAKLGYTFEMGAVKSNVGLRVGVDPWGNKYGDLGVSVTAGKLTVAAGLRTNFETVKGYASANLEVVNGLVNTSMSTGDTKPKTSAGPGFLNPSNNKSGNVSSKSFGSIVPVPFLYLGYNYRRTWIDEMDNVWTNGIFYNPTNAHTVTYHNNHAFDSYSLAGNYVFAYRKDPDSDFYGTFAAFDDYNVNAQGISGNMSPHSFRQHLYRQNKIHYEGEDKIYDVIHQPTEKQFSNNTIQFRFINDFSNRYEYDNEEFTFNTSTTKEFPLSYGFTKPPVTGENGLDGIEKNHLAGSKNVSHFTNLQIKNGVDEFKETVSTGFNRNDAPDDQIGGYQVTNASGVTYHFSLPVYTQKEFHYSERRDEQGQKTFNYQSKPEKYAYTWFLTGITGPDYMDRGAKGFDKDDWGYWVELEYGKWTDKYNWRTPHEGMELDLDTDWKNYSEGSKELYYLDAIRTKTHTALFVKDIRKDAKSVIPVHRTNVAGKEEKYFIQNKDKLGGSIPKEVAASTVGSAIPIIYPYKAKPVSSLKLSKILLMDNSSASALLKKNVGNSFHQSMSFPSYYIDGTPDSYYDIDQHFPDNVLDIADISTGNENEAMRVIELETDNETLAMETPNSFHHSSLDGNSTPSLNANDYELAGKLTLKSLSFKGKIGATIVPPMKFDYELENQINGNGNIEQISSSQSEIQRYNLSSANNSLHLGDIIRFNSDGKVCYATVLGVGDKYQIQIIGKHAPLLGSIDWITTKNPPFNVDCYDEWGMYKGDYFDIGNDHIDRIRTFVSKNHIDAWSLRSVRTSMGSAIKMKYESDSYIKAVLTDSYPLVIDNFVSDAENYRTHITIAGDVTAADYFYDVGDRVDLLILYSGGEENCEGAGYPMYPKVWKSGKTGMIESINGNTITVKSKCLSQYFNVRNYLDEPCYESYDPNSKTVVDFSVPENNVPPDGGGGEGGCRPYYIRYYKSGNLKIDNPEKNIPGGGLRVSSLSIHDPYTSIVSTSYYTYNQPHKPNLSSGVTSFAPMVMDKYVLHADYDDNSNAAGLFRALLYSTFSDLISIASEVPAPGVLYEYVTVKESIKNGSDIPTEQPGYSQYHFQVFEKEMIEHKIDHITIPTDLISRVDKAGDVVVNYDHSESEVKEVTLNDYTTHLGQLKAVVGFTTDGRKVSETKYHFLEDDLNLNEFQSTLKTEFNNQGKIKQTFVDSRAVREESGLYGLRGTISSRVRYPSIPVGETNINYTTGITTFNKNLKFDFYSGAVIKTLNKDSYDNYYTIETTPAYKKYRGMGLAIYGGANMLLQEAESRVYKIDNSTDFNPTALVSASVQTWSDQIPYLGVDRNKYTFNLQFGSTSSDGTEYRFGLGSSERLLTVGQKLEVELAGTVFLAEVIAVNTETVILTFPKLPPYFMQFYEQETYDFSTYQSNLFQKHRTYSYTGDPFVKTTEDGLIPFSAATADRLEFDGWRHGEEPRNEGWCKNSEITLYDPYSHALEAVDVNGNYAATKMDVNQEQVYSTVANARYHEYGYTGFEKMSNDFRFSGGIQLGVGDANLGSEANGYHVHTGNVGVRVTLDGGYACLYNFPLDVDRTKTYQLSVWVHKDHKDQLKLYAKDGSGDIKTFTGAELSESKKAGDWYLATMDVPLQGTTGTIQFGVASSGGTGLSIDDFRFHPIDAVMTSYVYNKWGELSHILDANNLYTHFKYDGMGKLKSTHKESFDHGEVKVSEVNYGYALNHLANASNLSALGIKNDEVIKVGSSEQFSATGINSYGMSYRWDFDDGITSTSSSPSITFNEVGSRWVTLKVTDSKGYYNEVAKLITVRDCPRAGTIKSRTCLLSGPQCYSGIVRITYHDGDCDTYYIDEDASGDECSNNGACI